MSFRRAVLWTLILSWILISSLVVAVVAVRVNRTVTIIRDVSQNQKRSPFTRVEFQEGDAVRVQFEGNEYALVAIESLPTHGYVEFCRAQYGDKWEKRFAEDLVEVMQGMGVYPVNSRVHLTLMEPNTGRVFSATGLMTEANRTAVYNARNPDPVQLKVQLMPPQMRAVVDDFQNVLEQRWSYLAPSQFDHKALLAELRGRIDKGLPSDQLPVELQKVIARGIDGHAGVVEWERYVAAGFLPALLEPSGDRIVGIAPDRSGFITKDHPFVTAIDGKPIEEWMKAAAVFSPKGSPQYVRREALRTLRWLVFMRSQVGVKAQSTVEITLETADGAGHVIEKLPVGNQIATYGTWPREDRGPKKMPSGVGYLRLADMGDDKATAKIAAAMRRYASAKGLIIDVRGNGGGKREALVKVASILARPGDKPRVVNAAVCRVHPEHDEKMLMGSRFLYTEAWDGWKPAERETVAEFKKSFKPEIQLPMDQYSAWHYMVLRDDNLDPTFEKPIVVLMDGKCFSATDVFLSALKGMPNVTLMGMPSSGGSGNSEVVALAGTSLKVRLGTMVSFQRDGRLFDGEGVEPDVVVEPTPEFFVGGRDVQLEKAIALLQ